MSAPVPAARPPRRRGGRPPLPPGEQRRRQLTVSFTAAERASLEARAVTAGVRPAVYLRLAALCGGGADAVDLRFTLTQLHVELRRIGNNLNQLAHAANSALVGDKPPAVHSAVLASEATLTELRAALAAIRSALPPA